ncbi:MAG TPA: nucleotidyltransferase domain-containing protein [Spirochaetota bacterium]|mgnify:CR=1 FL=1|nr:nucleotidyltransferase domain-containing protein [Spirochaetota bacterium]
MDEIISEEIKHLTAKILEAVKVSKIYLFGSYAYGIPNNDSDIDLCVLTDENKRKIEIMTDIRRNIGFSMSHPLDIIVYKPKEFYERADSLTSMESQILKKGIVVYG